MRALDTVGNLLRRKHETAARNQLLSSHAGLVLLQFYLCTCLFHLLCIKVKTHSVNCGCKMPLYGSFAIHSLVQKKCMLAPCIFNTLLQNTRKIERVSIIPAVYFACCMLHFRVQACIMQSGYVNAQHKCITKEVKRQSRHYSMELQRELNLLENPLAVQQQWATLQIKGIWEINSLVGNFWSCENQVCMCRFGKAASRCICKFKAVHILVVHFKHAQLFSGATTKKSTDLLHGSFKRNHI